MCMPKKDHRRPKFPAFVKKPCLCGIHAICIAVAGKNFPSVRGGIQKLFWSPAYNIAVALDT